MEEIQTSNFNLNPINLLTWLECFFKTLGKVDLKYFKSFLMFKSYIQFLKFPRVENSACEVNLMASDSGYYIKNYKKY